LIDKKRPKMLKLGGNWKLSPFRVHQGEIIELHMVAERLQQFANNPRTKCRETMRGKIEIKDRGNGYGCTNAL
jgi:hypothetical protein